MIDKLMMINQRIELNNILIDRCKMFLTNPCSNDPDNEVIQNTLIHDYLLWNEWLENFKMGFISTENNILNKDDIEFLGETLSI